MLCWKGSSKYDPVDTEIINGVVRSNTNDNEYPAMRKRTTDSNTNNRSINTTKNLDLIQTGGNALMQYDPEIMSDFVKIVVPSYCQPGQLIQVVSPDDSKRVANVIIPRNGMPGSTFLIKFLPFKGGHDEKLIQYQQQQQQQQQLQQNISHELALTQEKNSTEAVSSQTNQIDLLDDHTNYSTNTTTTTTTTTTNPLEEKLLLPPPLPEEQRNNNGNEKQEETMMIIVPPGLEPGTTIYANLPGGNKRFLPVEVPKGGVPQFFVSFDYGHTISENEMLEQFQSDIEPQPQLQPQLKQERSRRVLNRLYFNGHPAAYAAPTFPLPRFK